jgi:hypothetical protein
MKTIVAFPPASARPVFNLLHDIGILPLSHGSDRQFSVANSA